MHSTITYTQGARPSIVPDETLATYRWVPPAYHAAVFLVHGFRSHARFNFLRNDSPSAHHLYGDGDGPSSSLVRELNARGLAVFAHDHVGHGASTGLRAYFPSFHALVQDTVAYVQAVDAELELSSRDMPLFVLGHSLGGTVAIVAARDNPSLFAGAVFSSAASEAPESMFGIQGRIQLILSGLTSTLVPKMELLAVPPSDDPHLQALYEADPLNCKHKIRARVGREFINAYADIEARLPDVTIPFLTASGENDTLVNPAAARRFHDGASSKDKTLFEAKGRWHALIIETGREEIWALFAGWIAQRSRMP